MKGFVDSDSDHSDATALFFSDVHLIEPSSLKTKLVIRFLEETASQFDRVYILGDLFDSWPSTSPFLLETFAPVLNALKQLVHSGHEVHYLEGNHDFHLGEHFHKELGIQVYPEDLRISLGGLTVHLSHGDLGNKDELGYRALRKILRSRLTHSAIRAIPPRWVYEVGLKWSQASRRRDRKQSAMLESKVKDIYRNNARRLFLDGADVVLMGHTHLPDDVTAIVGGRKCRYINTGDWVKNFTYVEFDGTQFLTKLHPITRQNERSLNELQLL